MKPSPGATSGVTAEGDRFFIEDLNSSHGTRLNGAQLPPFRREEITLDCLDRTRRGVARRRVCHALETPNGEIANTGSTNRVQERRYDDMNKYFSRGLGVSMCAPDSTVHHGVR